jgi:hypothetical protein
MNNDERKGAVDMSRRFFLGVDESENTLQALKNLGQLLIESNVNLQLFYALPESSLLYPEKLYT